MQVSRIFDLIRHQIEKNPKTDSICGKVDGSWKHYPSRDLEVEANRASLALHRLGVSAKDRVGLISSNRPEWNFIDLGILQLGAVNVPIYPTLADDDLVYILNHSGMKILLVEDAKNQKRLTRLKDKIPGLEQILSIDPHPKLKSWSELLPEANDLDLGLIEAFKDKVSENDLASLIYTSGTTGTPKAVMLTHKNIMATVKNSGSISPLGPNYRALSFLPLCHIFERTVNYVYLFLGVSIYYSESLATIAKDLQDVKPQVFVSVPRLIEKLYEKILAKGNSLSGISKNLFDWSLQLAENYDPEASQNSFQKLELMLARKLVLRKWREALGGESEMIFSGGASINVKILRAFAAAEVKILEGYGLTESSGMSTANRFYRDDQKLNTVGPAVDGVQIKIASEPGYPEGEGEICIKGDNVMSGYYQDPAATAEAMTSDGWFKTGDIGKFVDGKFLKITDRKKDVFKTSGGKYVAPLVIETRLKQNTLIEQVVIVGDGEKFPAALIVPNFLELERLYPQAKGEHVKSCSDETIRAIYKTWIQEVNHSLGAWEQVKNFILLADEWTVDSGELTPTLKPKRKFILKKYETQIHSLFH